MSSSRERFRIEVVKRAQQRLVERRADGLAIEDDLHDAVRTSAELRRAIDRAWPPTTGAALVRRLLTNRGFLARFADGWLTADEQRLLLRRRAGKDKRGLDPRRRRPGRRGRGGPRWARPPLRPPRRGRGPGPLGDGVADGGPPLRPVPLPHRAGRPRPGHRPGSGGQLARRRRRAGLTHRGAGGRARDGLPRAGPDPRPCEPAPPGHRCPGPPVALGQGRHRHLLAPSRPRAPTPRP